MRPNQILFSLLFISISGFSRNIAPPKDSSVFSAFKVGTPLLKVKKFFQNQKVIQLSDGGVARKFSYDFTSIGGAEVNEGIVVTYNDTIRALLVILDSANGNKLWDGMVDLYGSQKSSAVLNKNEWLINKVSFSMYEVNNSQHANFRDVAYFEKMNMKNYIVSEIDKY